MQQIIDFIIRKKDVVVYFILLLFSLSLIFNSNYFHRSKVIILLNNISSFSSENFDYINEYFELKDINLDLTKKIYFLKIN